MKKIISVVLSILIIIPISVSVFSNGYEQSKNAVTKKEAYQFAKEIKEMNASKYDVKNRLIVSSNKSIDYLDAVDVSGGIDGLYVLQFSNSNAVNKAFDYYNSLPYVNYVECDFSQESVSCGVEDELDFVPE